MILFVPLWLQDIRRVDRVWINGLYGSGKAKPIDLYAQGTGDREDNPALQKRNQYMQDFEHGIDCYIHGDWVEAKQVLEDCKKKRDKDGPVIKILEYMETAEKFRRAAEKSEYEAKYQQPPTYAHDPQPYEKPKDWPKYRHNDI